METYEDAVGEGKTQLWESMKMINDVIWQGSILYRVFVLLLMASLRNTVVAFPPAF